MCKLGICGHYNFGSIPVGGQTIKTRIITKSLINIYGMENITEIDTEGWKRNPAKLFFNCVKIAKMCDHIIILPAHNGIKVLIPFFLYLKKIFKFELHYIVVGAWLFSEIQNNKWLINKIKQIDFIYVQTKTLKEKLSLLDINNNVLIFPNFKLSPQLNKKNSINRIEEDSLYLCILSRINEEKGIVDAINSIKILNDKFLVKKIYLDIYGPIESNFSDKFCSLLKINKEYVSYKGVVKYDETISIISLYDILLFPTKYYTEGFPGTIIDSFMAGTPVLVSRWESYSDVVQENITGLSYEFDNIYDLVNKLEYIINNRLILKQMSRNCIIESKKYLSDNVIKILTNNI